MRSSQIVELICYQRQAGAFSDEGTRQPVKRKIYANTYRLSYDHVLRARVDGIRLSGKVEIYSFEYQRETHIGIAGNVYQIVDAQTRGDRMVISYGDDLNEH